VAKKTSQQIPVLVEFVERRIYLIRAQKVMLDFDLAEIYGVATKRLNEQVTRNSERFPEDFMFRLSRKETDLLSQSQFATGSQKHRDTRYPPRAFTEQGVSMLSGILRSPRAIQANIAIMRAFVRQRRMLANHEELARKLDKIESKYDAQFRVVFDAIRKLMAPSEPPRKRPPGSLRDVGSGRPRTTAWPARS
jgi:hypothetical protein